MFASGSRAWSFAPSISLPIFDGGRRRASLDLAEVRRNLSVAHYEKTVQTAFREVSDALASSRWLAQLVSIQQDWVDAVSADDSILAGMAAQDPNLEIVGPDLESEPYGIVMNRNDPDLVRFVNGTLERIRADGTWMRLYDHWYSAVLGPVAGPPSPTYRD